MANQIENIMSRQVHTMPLTATVLDVARSMRDKQIGDVIVTNKDGTLRGIVTDRDIVVRAVATGKPLDKTAVADICTNNVVKLAPTATLDEAVQMMREHAIRRIPVVRDGHPVGIVTIGDLARHQEPRSTLAQISAAKPNN